jgi:uncharacterized membrane protein
MKSAVFFSRVGCILPLLIILNLFFGWLVFKPLEWLAVGVALILLFLLNSAIAARRILSGAHKDSRIIDVEGKVIKGEDSDG